MKLTPLCFGYIFALSMISNLVTDYIQKSKREPGLFSFEYNLLPKLISNFYHYMDQASVLEIRIHIIFRGPPQITKHLRGMGWYHPQTTQLLSRRGPRYPDARLSQHYISPKMKLCHFPNFCRKKILAWQNKFPCTFWMNLEVFPTWFLQIKTPKGIQKCAGFFLSGWETFYCRNLKNDRISFFGQCNVETASHPGI